MFFNLIKVQLLVSELYVFVSSERNISWAEVMLSDSTIQTI